MLKKKKFLRFKGDNEKYSFRNMGGILVEDLIFDLKDIQRLNLEYGLFFDLENFDWKVIQEGVNFIVSSLY